jgi:biotin carboxyl carrier protein
MSVRSVRCPIAGTVLERHKSPGESVTADEPVVTLECMKMEIPIQSPVAGRLVSVDVKEGEVVVKDQLVFAVET